MNPGADEGSTGKAPADYTNEAQQRILGLLRIMAGNEFNGLSPKEIREATGCSGSIATRDLFNLQKAGFAEQIPATDRWRLGPKLVQIGVAFMTHLSKQRQQLDDITNRYTREP